MTTRNCVFLYDDRGDELKIIENNGQYKITLPKDLVLDKGWKAGDEIRFVEDTEGRIFLKVIPVIDAKR